MPKLGMSMKKGAVAKWLSAEGDSVEAGANLCEISTQKITAKILSPASGVLGRVLADPRVELPVGALLALIGDPGDTFPSREELRGVPATSAPALSPAAAAPSLSIGASAGVIAGGALASPAARRRAKDLGIDIALVPPAGSGRRITTEEVDAFAAAQAAGGVRPAGQILAFSEMRQVVAERLTASLLTMAQVTVTREAVVWGLVARRTELGPKFEAVTGIRLSYMDLLVETVARLLHEHPLLNSTLTDDGIVVPQAVQMGVAVALDAGLIVPVIRNADTKSLAEIARDRVSLAAKAQAGTLSLGEIDGGTFTISNLGSFGADAFTPIVNPPQCAILGVGRIVDKPVAVDGEVQVRPTMWVSLTFDHRIVDGAPATRFLQALADRLA